MSENMDEAIESVGGFGRWHFCMYFTIFAIVFFRAMVALAIVFMEYTPEFVCNSTLLDDLSTEWTFEQAREISAPISDSGITGCEMYRLNYSHYRSLGYEQSLRDLPENRSTLDVLACDNGHYFKQDFMDNSVVTQWDLVCDKSIWIANTQTIFVLGIGIGLLLSGTLSHNFGRKPVIIILGFVGAVIGCVDPFVKDFNLFLFLRFLLGVFRNETALYTLTFEISNHAMRDVVTALYWAFSSAGGIALAALAYFTRDWRWMHALSNAPLLIIYPLCYWILPESPRWLAARGRTTEANRVLERMAHLNHNTRVNPIFRITKSTDIHNSPLPGRPPSDRTTPVSYSYFLCNARQLIRLLIVYYTWFSKALVYSGIMLLITDFSGNIFINNGISNALEFPAYILVYIFLLWSHKKAQILCMLLGASVLFAAQLIPSELAYLELASALLGKLVITASYSLTYLVTSELYPSQVRAGFLLSADMVGILGYMASPYLSNIAKLFPNLNPVKTPLLLFGIFSILAAVFEIWIPETRNRVIPESIEELP